MVAARKEAMVAAEVSVNLLSTNLVSRGGVMGGRGARGF
jgi:hypothetical protein